MSDIFYTFYFACCICAGRNLCGYRTSNYFNLIFGLVFVIFLIYLTGFFYQKLIGVGSKINKKAQGQNCAANKVKILSSMPLGRSKNIYTVSVNGKTLVLGATENQITLLREFSEDEIAQYTKDLCDEEYDDE